MPPFLPTLYQRLAMRDRPRGAAVMYQRWRDLLFLHWRYPADAIQATLPPGLFVDTHEGHAYLGVVPFVMRDVRPRFLPPVPGLSNFLELNLRTYVHDAQGIPGVWFYSLDANQRIAVEVARRLFHLLYERARMTMRRSVETITFTSQRLGAPRGTGASTFSFRPHGVRQIAVPDSLEFFLGERYRLYSSTPSGLRRGAVYVHTAVWVPEDDRAFATRLARYCARNPVALERLTYDRAAKAVTYRSDKSEGPTAGTETADPLEFLARVLVHIPDKGHVTTRYYGWYANRPRGMRRQAEPAAADRSYEIRGAIHADVKAHCIRRLRPVRSKCVCRNRHNHLGPNMTLKDVVTHLSVLLEEHGDYTFAVISKGQGLKLTGKKVGLEIDDENKVITLIDTGK